MSSIPDDEVCEIVHSLSDDQVNSDKEVQNLPQKKDEHFLSNAGSRLFNLWRAIGEHENTESMRWSQYIQQTKQIFRNFEKMRKPRLKRQMYRHYGLNYPESSEVEESYEHTRGQSQLNNNTTKLSKEVALDSEDSQSLLHLQFRQTKCRSQ